LRKVIGVLIKIREYTDDDRQSYLVVYVVGYYHSLYRDWLFKYPLELSKPKEVCLMAYENDIPVGLVEFKEGGDIIDVSELLVLPEHRRKGVARALISQLERRAKERGIPEIMATVPYGVFEGDTRLQELLQIYKKLGFDLDGVGAWVGSGNIPEGLIKARDRRDNMVYVSERDLQRLKEANITPQMGKARNYDMIRRA